MRRLLCETMHDVCMSKCVCVCVNFCIANTGTDTHTNSHAHTDERSWADVQSVAWLSACFASLFIVIFCMPKSMQCFLEL